MFGQRVHDIEWKEQLDCACENFSWAVSQIKATGITLLIEALNPDRLSELCNAAVVRVALDVLKRTNHPSVKLLYDVYHAQLMEGT